ncbi:hypothetical protein AB0D38_18120 [Streptomyces sp. NPDC048279]
MTPVRAGAAAAALVLGGLDESALSGHELIVRELGATVVDEFRNE